MKNSVEIFLEDISYHTKYEFLDMGKNGSELQEIAKKCRIKFPCNDLAIFKGTYAYVDRQNKNGCTLIKAEVEKSLDSLVGKAVDFDHFRKRVVGHWIDAKLEGDTIIAYGVFFKGNFYDDYGDVKTLIETDKLGISFEAWGTKEMKTANTYNLNEIEFAGGALLMKEQPAFDGAEVLEMAKERVLEFASVMTKPSSFIHTEGDSKVPQQEPEKGKDDLPELARYYINDVESIMRVLSNAECPSCKGKGMYGIESIDFAGNQVKVKCMCDALLNVELTPVVKMEKKGRDIMKMTQVVPSAKVEVVEKSKIEVKKNWLDAFENSKDDIAVIEEAFMNEMEYAQDENMMHCMKCEWNGPKDECTDEKCPECNGPVETVDEDVDEGKKLTYKQRTNITDDLFAVIKEVKNKVTGEPRKIRMFPVADPAHVRNALARLAQTKVKETLRSLGVSIDSVKQKILKRARELNMKDLLDRYEKATVEEQAKLFKETIEEVAKLRTDSEAKDKDVATLKESVTAKDAELATLKTELDTVKKTAETATAEIARRDKEIRDAEIAKRKTDLGDIAKDMTDEDVMNEDKYKIAKLTKENADLKAQVEATAKAAAEKAAAAPAAEPAKGSTEPKPEADLDKGSKDKKKDTEVFTTQKRVTEKAFGKETKE